MININNGYFIIIVDLRVYFSLLFIFFGFKPQTLHILYIVTTN